MTQLLVFQQTWLLLLLLLSRFSHVGLCATTQTAAYQAAHGIFQARVLEWVAIAFSVNRHYQEINS